MGFSVCEDALQPLSQLSAPPLRSTIADMPGRKRICGYEVLVLAIGAVASAFSPNIWWLILFRVILGVGVGGDYPVLDDHERICEPQDARRGGHACLHHAGGGAH